jgi:nucleoside-diphosphate-sugar epimerase
MKTILVTGCAGFIGSRFIEIFHDKYPNVSIVGIDNFSTGKKSLINDSFKFYEISIEDKEKVNNVFSTHKPDFVFHFAAMPRVQYCQENPTETNITNIIGTSNIFECSSKYGVKRVMYSSSAAVYGNVESLPVKEDTNKPNPLSFYGFQKYAGEPLAKIMSLYKNIDVACLRYFNVYGPRQDGTSSYATVIARWLDAIKEGKPIIIEGDGFQSRDFVYVDDVVLANISAMSANAILKGEAFNIATNTEISLNEVRSKIEKELNIQIKVEHKPSREGDIKHIKADISKAKDILNWTPITDFDTGIKNTVIWYLSKNNEK